MRFSPGGVAPGHGSRKYRQKRYLTFIDLIDILLLSLLPIGAGSSPLAQSQRAFLCLLACSALAAFFCLQGLSARGRRSPLKYCALDPSALPHQHDLVSCRLYVARSKRIARTGHDQTSAWDEETAQGLVGGSRQGVTTRRRCRLCGATPGYANQVHRRSLRSRAPRRSPRPVRVARWRRQSRP